MDGFAYLPGTEPAAPGPLGRYLPPAPGGIAAAFLPAHCQPGAWVLDPFGASPSLAVESARQGYRVLVSVNNPIMRFLLELAADPPPADLLRAALSDLAAARKGSERLETHLQALYLTTCTKCQKQVQADAFVWERGADTPVARLYRCPCGESGEFPVTEADQALARQFTATDSLHRARALERVAAPNDPDRQHVLEALECYLPRSVYALITIVNRLDGLDSMPPPRRRALIALILAAFDEANTLWPHPSERPRPRLLTVPPRFLEKNVWLVLERIVDSWLASGELVNVVNWPELPAKTGGLCLFDGPVRDLAPRLKEIPIAAVLTVLPRPNQAFWTLSALWSGWLWGRPAAAPFKFVLRRRRYDWNWHAAALYAAFKNISAYLPLQAPLFAIIPEIEPSFLSAVLLAAAGAGFDLSGLALRTHLDPAQIVWHKRAFSLKNEEHPGLDPASVRLAMLAALNEHGEPVSYLYLHAAGLMSMAADQSLHWRQEALTRLHAPILAALAGSDFVHHADSPNPEIGLWGLADWSSAAEPLPDRVEVAAIRHLNLNPGTATRDIETLLNAAFPGLQTPSKGLIQIILSSYAIETDAGWALRPEDLPSARRADLESAAQALDKIAPMLGYTVSQKERLIRWNDSTGKGFTFHLVASCVVGTLLHSAETSPQQNILVLPGGRAGLLAYKLERDPALRAAAEGWRVLKFRHLRRLAGIPGLTRERWEKELSADPLELPEQMKLL